MDIASLCRSVFGRGRIVRSGQNIGNYSTIAISVASVVPSSNEIITVLAGFDASQFQGFREDEDFAGFQFHGGTAGQDQKAFDDPSNYRQRGGESMACGCEKRLHDLFHLVFSIVCYPGPASGRQVLPGLVSGCGGTALHMRRV